jgi:hypothetical protein
VAYSTTAELLAGFKFFAMRPATDESITDAQIYVLLSEGQAHVYGMFAVHFPEILYEVPTALSTSDSGATYTFASAIFPFGNVEIRSGLNGNLLIPGTNWDGNADYVWEGDRIRIPNGRTRTFSSGLYARYIKMPTDISGSQEPVLEPAFARKLIMYYALYLWAERGGGANQADPNRFLGMFQSAWAGDPRLNGDVGILGMLARQGYGSGMAAISVDQPWWRGSPDIG